MRSLLLLLVAAVTAFAVFSWVRVGRDRYAGLEDQGRALARVVRGASVEASARLRSAEASLAARLTAVARRADTEIAATRQPAAEVLQRIAREEHIGRAFLWDGTGRPVVRVQHPPMIAGEASGMLTLERKRKLQWAAAERSRAADSPKAGEVAVEGLQLNAFGTRERFGVLLGRRAGGTLLLLADGDELATLHRQFGLQRMLQHVLEAPGVAAVQVLGSDGSVRMGVGAEVPLCRDPGSVRGPHRVLAYLRTVLPVDAEPEPLHAAVWLERAGADEAVADARQAILFGALLALVIAVGAGALLVRRESAHQRERRVAEARLEEERRLAEMGALAGLVTHEVNNPLNSIRLALGVLEGTELGRASTDILSTMKTEVARMEQTLGGYMALAGGDRRPPKEVTSDLLVVVLKRVSVEADRLGVELSLSLELGAPSAAGDPVILDQALSNLARNAIQASPPGGEVELSWAAAEDGGVVVEVRDEGAGFPKDRAALLRLGGTQREMGHGLGLPLAKRFVESSGGRLSLDDAPSGGARVVVHLPAWEGSPSTDV